MQIGSRFTIGVHIITAIDYFRDMDRVNSEFLAGSIGVNPVIVRTVISQLRQAGILQTQRGSSGAELAKRLDQITLYDVYRAVGSVDAEEGLFHFHEQPNPECPVGRNIHAVLDQRLMDAQRAMEEKLRSTTLEEIAEDTRRAVLNEKKSQNALLDYLVEQFKADSVQYKDLRTPADSDGKRRVLRSLMNIRMPGKLDDAVLDAQDAYLQQRIRQNGIVTLENIPVKAGVISIWQGDITRLAVDAIVNAANSQMLGCFVPMHTCIDNCIHTFAGVQLREECSRRMKQLRAKYGPDYEQPTAVPMLTDAYNLPAKKVIHIVGPIVSGRLTPELEQELAACYTNTLDMCAENGLRSVAFCCISTGVFHFPPARAAQIAVETVKQWLADHGGIMDRVIFNVFSDRDRELYEHLFK